MKAIHFEHPGGPEALKIVEIEKPTPKTGEVLIRVVAAGVNRPDLLQRKGAYPPPSGASPLLGLEVSGVIEECGPECSKWKVGDEVCALVAGGGYAEYCVAPEQQCLVVPPGLSLIEAAGIPETFFTVWFNVFMRGRLQSGESILIHGGSSGIGTTAIQLSKAFGAKVFVTAGTQDKCQACLGLGADAAIDYKIQNFVEEGLSLTSGKGVNMILDMVGGDYLERNLQLLVLDGRIIQIAFQKGDRVNLSLRALMAKGATLTGSTLRARSIEQKGKIAEELLKSVWPLFQDKKIRVPIHQIFPLESASHAHQTLEEGNHIGKLILQMG